MSQIRRKKLYEDVMAGIIELIKSENLSAGDRLQGEKELSARFGVSRMVVRESLSALQSTGVIQVRHGSGIYVNDINERLVRPIQSKFRTPKDKLLNIMEVRTALEAEAACLAAMRALPEDISNIESYLVKLAAAIKSGKTTAHEDDLQFHRTIIATTRNLVYIEVFDGIASTCLEDVRLWQQIIEGSFDPRSVVTDEYTAILENIRSGCADGARDRMREHLRRVTDTLRKIL